MREIRSIGRGRLGMRLLGFLTAAVLLAAPAAFACTGDCDGDDAVSVDELMKGVNVALGMDSTDLCPFFDRNSDDAVTVDEVLAGVSADLAGCPLPGITTVAGNGLAGLNGDGHAPTDSALYLPQDGTVGPDGNLYFADWNNHRLRRIKDGVV